MGLPLTGELLPMMLDAVKRERLFAGLSQAREKRQEIINTVRELVPGLNSQSKLPSIVDLLSLIDYSLAEGFTVLRTGRTEQLRRSRALLEAGLLDVLSRASVSYSRPALNKFRNLLSEHECCIITTNYDSLPDIAIRPLLSETTAIDYGMAWRKPEGDGSLLQRPSKATYSLFKLHGSVNWLGCPFCEHIYINQRAEIALLDNDDGANRYGDEVTCHCGYAPLHRVIVSPSLSRGAYQTQLRAIHLAALEALRSATEIYIVGYSLPVEDLMVRSLFLRGISNRSSKRVLKVFQVSEDARYRYDMHFVNYDYLTSGFDGFLRAF